MYGPLPTAKSQRPDRALRAKQSESVTLCAVSEFVDETQICVRGGTGGAGCVSFRREAHVPRGGPDGGDGGKGGDVWLVADRNTSSLIAFRDHPHRTADSGTHGRGRNAHGSAGDDLIVAVPEGTVVKDRDGVPLADLVGHGDRWLAAEGGRGGKGNARFLSNRRRAPSFAEQGENTEEQWLRLELKLMADVALVGFPNVGKSTLISVISAAKPKIANYPFTTLVPNLGVVRLDDGFDMVVADIPGLIEGASEGRGLGDQFLRHIERASVVAILCDLAPVDGTSPKEQEELLLRELGAYDPDLLDRPRVLVGTKADFAEAEVVEHFDGLVVSAITGAGVADVLGEMRRLVESARAAHVEAESWIVHRPAPEGFWIERADDGGWEVFGRDAHRAVAFNDLTNLDALSEAHKRLKKLGVIQALQRRGVRVGDSVTIGALSFEYADD